MRSRVFAAGVFIAAIAALATAAPATDTAVDTLFRARAHERWTRFTAKVERLLRDDNKPPRHQRFLVRTASGLSVLVVHNIDLAPRLAVRAGDRVTVRGKYLWNSKGGQVHWTHRDPRGRGPHGWLRNERTGTRAW